MELGHPFPGSIEERHAFEILQRGLAPMFSRVFCDPRAARTVVVIPSMSLDHEELAKLPGATRYEERFLCLLMLLQLPATEVVDITSERVAPPIVAPPRPTLPPAALVTPPLDCPAAF